MILKFFAILPELIKLIERIIKLWENYKKEGVIDEINKALDELEKAKTKEERINALVNLSKSFNK